MNYSVQVQYHTEMLMKDKTSEKGLYSKLLQQTTDCCSSENHV